MSKSKSGIILSTTQIVSPFFVYLGKIPGIILKAEHGKRIEELVKNVTQVTIEITEGPQVITRIEVKKSSVLFVSVSFIVLMIVSLAWLVFYYIQRFRYAQARGRTQVILADCTDC